MFSILFVLGGLILPAQTYSEGISVPTLEDLTPPEIYLNGENPMSILQGVVFIDPGAYAVDVTETSETIIDVIVSGDLVNTNVVGVYKIIYTTTDLAGNSASVTRIVNVNDVIKNIFIKSPVSDSYLRGNIELVADISEIGITPSVINFKFWQKGKGSDIGIDTDIKEIFIGNGKCDGKECSIIWETSKVADGLYEIWIKSSDDSYVSELVAVTVDNTIPVITMLGSATVNLETGDTYTDAGATALDNIDGDITTSIVKSGTFLNTENVGTYSILYNVSDKAGNSAVEVMRTINIEQAPSNDGGNGGGGSSGGSYVRRPVTLITPVVGEVLGAEDFIFTLLLKKGSSGNEVTELQKFLNAAGYNCGVADGLFGPKTKLAVENFQRMNPPLTIDGIVGPQTRSILNK